MLRPAGYSNYGWSLRTMRTLPVVAMAALLGGAIGGFSVYAISVALNEAPGSDSVVMKADAARPIRTAEAPVRPGQAPQQVQAAPLPQTAASQTETTPPQAAVTAETPPPVLTPPAGPETVAAAAKPVPPKPSPQKRRVVSRKPLPAPYQSGELAARSQPVYDYYDGNYRNGDAASAPRGMYSPPLNLNPSRTGRHATITGADGSNTRVVVRRQSRDGYYQSYVPRGAGPMLPPQSAPPGLFGGIYGGGYRDDGWR